MKQFIRERCATSDEQQLLRLLIFAIILIFLSLFFSSCSIAKSISELEVNPYVTQHITLEASMSVDRVTSFALSIYQPKPLLVEQEMLSEITSQGCVRVSYSTKAHEAAAGWPLIISAIGSAVAGWLARALVTK